jgi:PST family polysaccharide transporter
MYPEMARDTGFGKQMKGLRPLLAVAFLISVFVFLFAKPMISILFGVEFVPSVQPLQIMIWVVSPYVFVTYSSLGLVALGFEKPVLLSLFTALAVLLVSLILLNFAFGLNGAAAAVLFSEIIHAALLWRQWRVHVISKLPE